MRAASVGQGSGGGKPRVAAGLAAVVVLVVAATSLVYFGQSGPPDAPPWDADLCPSDPALLTGSTVFLLDLSKPVDEEHLALPGELLHEVLATMGRDSELLAYLLSGSEDTPRRYLGRLCKPFADADLQVATKDWDGLTVRDCDDLPAQIPPDLRSAAGRFCSLREAMQARLAAEVASASRASHLAGGVHLVEALEDTRLEFEERDLPQRLFVFSDMMQHAPWYSHLDLEWGRWRHADLVQRTVDQGWPPARPYRRDETTVDVFYVPRSELTAQPRIQAAHKRFWREYFAAADVTFRDQPPMRQYTAPRLMESVSEEELAARDRAEAERLLEQVREEQERIRRAQEEVAREAALQREREAELARQEARVRQREAELALEAAIEQPVPSEVADVESGGDRDVGSVDSSSGGEGVRDAGDADETRPDAPVATAQPRDLPSDGASDAETRRREAASDGGGAAGVETVAREPAAMPQPAPATLRSCDISLREGSGLYPGYPGGGRRDFGDATVRVAYVVDEQGDTVDGEVRLVAAQSQLEHPRYLDLFADQALRLVRDWRFEFVQDSGQPCERRQARAVSFVFTYP